MAQRLKVALGPVARISPTLWSQMRLCMLRAGLSASPDADDWVLHSPRTWLGTAFHRLMAARPSDEAEAERLWNSTIDQLLAVAHAHPLDKRFATSERWPGYYLVRQRAIASAVRSARSDGPAAWSGVPPLRATEKFLTARNGFLAGRPDHFDLHAVTEYKSALPDPGWQEAESILDGYWRQLRLYAVL